MMKNFRMMTFFDVAHGMDCKPGHALYLMVNRTPKFHQVL